MVKVMKSLNLLTLVVLLGICITPAFANDYLPLEIGNWWKMDAVEIDSLGNVIAGSEYQTVTIISGDTLIEGQPYYIMQDSTNQLGQWEVVEQNYFRASGDTVYSYVYSPETGNWQMVTTAVLPNDIGYTWTVYEYDTTFFVQEFQYFWEFTAEGEILDYSSITVPAGTFDNTYLFRHNYKLLVTVPSAQYADSIYWSRDFWTSEGVGPIKGLTTAMIGFGAWDPGHTEELTDYQLPVGETAISLFPTQFELDAPYPNPFNPSTGLILHLPVGSYVTAALYDSEGRQIQNLVSDWYPIGTHRLIVNGDDLSSGIYFLTVNAGDNFTTKRLILLK